jgi:hypothetical protein
MPDDQVEFNCPHCNQLYKLTTQQLQRYAGRSTNCRKCQQPFQFPSAAEPEPEPEQEAAEEQPVEEEPAPQQHYAAGPAYEPPSQPQYVPNAAAPQPAQRQSLNYRGPQSARPKPSVLDFLLFRAMVTPVIIQVVFWFGVALFIYAGVMMIQAALNPPPPLMPGFNYGGRVVTPSQGINTELLVVGLGYAILGPILVRVYCELIVVLFRILDALRDVKDVLDDRLPRP